MEIELSIVWNVGATTIIMIKSTKKISVSGVIFISVNNAFLPDFIDIFTSYNATVEDVDLTFTSSSESTKLKNNNLINWKSSSNLLTIDWNEL